MRGARQARVTRLTRHGTRRVDIHGLTYTTSDKVSDYARSATFVPRPSHPSRARRLEAHERRVLLLQQHRAHIAEEFVRVIVSRRRGDPRGQTLRTLRRDPSRADGDVPQTVPDGLHPLHPRSRAVLNPLSHPGADGGHPGGDAGDPGL